MPKPPYHRTALPPHRVHYCLFFLILTLLSTSGRAQSIIRGNVIDGSDGSDIAFGTVRLTDVEGRQLRGTNTDLDGFFSFAGVDTGRYRLVATYVGYDSTVAIVSVTAAEQIKYERLSLQPAGVSLSRVEVSAARQRARDEVAVARTVIGGDQLLRLPTTGGEPDIAQYLTVLPGVVSSGDQGGQLYIRGGSPVQNKVLLDGMTIYNPFHSIGLFSVFETEAIRAADVYTAGFNAEYGGRISAIVDIDTREGNQRRFSGLVSASPFQVKALVEGPIKPLGDRGGSISYLVTGKQGLLSETSPTLYDYATPEGFFNTDDSTATATGLPYDYRDIYGKVSFVGGGGSKLQLFGFNFTDDFAVPGLASLGWTNNGGGGSFVLIPPNSNLVIDGVVSASVYDISLLESAREERSSGVANYTAQLNFRYYGRRDEFAYGFEFNGLNTDFSFVNPVGVTFTQEDFTSELNGYAKYKRTLGDLIVEPGLRAQYYASLSTLSIEPRLGLKYALTDGLRLKAAGGLYSQNLIATQNDLDIVNFFQGFLVGPESTIFEPGAGTRVPTDDNLQRAIHGVAGLEIDAGRYLTVGLEGYYKGFTRLIELNRNKLLASDPDFIALNGNAYGGDVTVGYRRDRLELNGNYSLGWVTRDDGEQEYPASFDRRHTVNAYGSYAFGSDDRWRAGFRFLLGSAFPFTQTLGFVENPNLEGNPVLADVLTGNGDIDVVLSPVRNGGRLSDIHRLDLSLQRTFEFSRYSRLELTASVSNAYDRRNIFYVDRIRGGRVDQLPILPSLTATFHW